MHKDNKAWLAVYFPNKPVCDTTYREWRNGKGVWTRMDPCRVQPWVILIFQLIQPYGDY